MRNLGKTIDELIKMDPDLEKKLIRIKKKWKRYPSKTEDYWKELLDFLNSKTLSDHPQRNRMKNILNPKKRNKHEIYSFETVHPNDVVVGALPGNIADIVRRHDRRSIQIAKLRVEADITKNQDLVSNVLRKEMLLEIDAKRLWIKIKDHFKLWDTSTNHTIKSKDSILVLVEQNTSTPTIVSPGVVKMDANTFNNFLRFLGIDKNQIPPEQLPPDMI